MHGWNGQTASSQVGRRPDMLLAEERSVLIVVDKVEIHRTANHVVVCFTVVVPATPVRRRAIGRMTTLLLAIDNTSCLRVEL